MVVKARTETNYGNIAFILGMVIAIVIGIVQAMKIQLGFEAYVGLILVVLGLIIGWLNIKDEQATDFLIATVSLAVVGLVSLNPALGTIFQPIIEWIGIIIANIMILIAPAVLVVSLKQIVAKSKD